jgi:predicted ATPase
MLIHSLTMKNVLSFGPESKALSLGPLNVLIGPNGSGKSNLIECIALLQSAPRALALPIREGGGFRDWLWKGTRTTPVATIEAVVANPEGSMPLRYRLEFTEIGQRFQLTDECIENERAYDDYTTPYFYFRYENNQPVLNVRETHRPLRREDVDPEQSILSQRKDPDQYPEITYLGEALSRIRLYREWGFGSNAPARLPQKTDLPNEFLDEDCRNLGLVLNRLRRDPPIKRKLGEHLRLFYEGIDDFEVSFEGGTVQIFFQEGDFIVPATRLSDGTMRYLCLLAILCHPKPPPLVCIEEPELGLHPDVIVQLADILVEASERTQIIVTTHSDVLVDALTDHAESVVVCEKHGGCTTMQRRTKEDLSVWLKDYTLGQLWRSGELGGTRW